jgi:Bax protein
LATGRTGTWRAWIAAIALAVIVVAAALGGAAAWFLVPEKLEYSVSLDPADAHELVINLQESQPVLTVLMPDNAARIDRLFTELSYDLRRIRLGRTDVPRVFLTSMPADLGQVGNIRRRKATFVRTMLPLVLKANEEIRVDRERIQAIALQGEAGIEPDAEQSKWLRDIAVRYKVGSADIRVLLRRVDEVPASLVIAQAIEESGWGTSRFTQQGNSLFGQYTWSADTPGIVPDDRPEDGRYKIKAFETLLDAIRAYMHNLNSHRAYLEFRELRSALRRQNKVLSGVVLAGTLAKYSERGDAYVSTIRSLMISERLSPFDTASLAGKHDSHLVHLVSAKVLAAAYRPGT